MNKHKKYPSLYKTAEVKRVGLRGAPRVYRVVAQDHPEHDRVCYLLLAQPHGHVWWHVDKLNPCL